MRALLAALLLAVPAGAELKNAETGCDPTQQRQIDAASAAATPRIKRAIAALSGPREGAPPAAKLAAERAHEYARVLFAGAYSPNDALRTMSEMGKRIDGKWNKVVCAPKGEKECLARDRNGKLIESRGGYYSPDSETVFLCSSFFEATEERRVRIIIHEFAHASGVMGGSKLPSEYYCGSGYTCDGPCAPDSPADNADDWAQLVNCAAGEKPDAPSFQLVIHGGR